MVLIISIIVAFFRAPVMMRECAAQDMTHFQVPVWPL
jgi:hypothetical protein